MIIFNIAGGIGKCVAATAVCKAIKKQFPTEKIVVVSAYPEVFLTNPNVYRNFSFSNLNYFYSDYIEGKDVKIFSQDPYLETSFIKQDTHLIKVWCEMYDIPYNGELPELYLTDEEKKFWGQKYLSDKPILAIQTNGGAIGQSNKYSWVRDIPEHIVKGVIKEFYSKYNIAHIKRPDQISYENTIPISDDFRSVSVLIYLSQKRLLMDSFAQHVAASLKLPSTVLWVGNSPKVFGYEIHNNILANIPTKESDLKSSFLQKYDITGDLIQFPYNNEVEIFNLDTIIKELK
jgi:hypothetical protein